MTIEDISNASEQIIISKIFSLILSNNIHAIQIATTNNKPHPCIVGSNKAGHKSYLTLGYSVIRYIAKELEAQ